MWVFSLTIGGIQMMKKEEMIFHIKNWWGKERKRFGMALGLGIFLTTAVFVVDTAGYATKVQSGIAKKVVRFHVLANSDTKEDQWLKLQVRDRVLEEVGSELEEIDDLEESKTYLKKNIVNIKHIAEAEMERLGYDYKASVSLERTQFPLKTYGQLTFPAGIYDALRIEIGTGKGQNWWCVVYPSMCFVDAACGEVKPTSKVKLKKTLTKEEYEVVSAREQKRITPKMKLKVVELWQERKAKK